MAEIIVRWLCIRVFAGICVGLVAVPFIIAFPDKKIHVIALKNAMLTAAFYEMPRFPTLPRKLAAAIVAALAMGLGFSAAASLASEHGMLTWLVAKAYFRHVILGENIYVTKAHES